MLPEDAALDPEVLDALSTGRLRTVVSLFPGACIVNGEPVPRASAMAVAGIGFRVHPGNDLAISMPGRSAEAIRKACQDFNHGPPIPFDKTSARAELALLSAQMEPTHAIGLKMKDKRGSRPSVSSQATPPKKP